MKLKVLRLRQLRFHHLALALTVCLIDKQSIVRCKPQQQQQTKPYMPKFNLSQDSRWIPMTRQINTTTTTTTTTTTARPSSPTEQNKISSNMTLVDCCMQLMAVGKSRMVTNDDDDDDGSTMDSLLSAASVMAPSINRAPRHSARPEGGGEEDGDNNNTSDLDEASDDSNDDDETGSEEEPQYRGMSSRDKLSKSNARGRTRPAAEGRMRPNDDQQQETNESADQEQADGNGQEAAERREAELADRLALDEQVQQQREIILAQAQSEAKAIKQQQEALLRQQHLQHLMQQRHYDRRGSRNGASYKHQPTSKNSEQENDSSNSNKHQQSSLVDWKDLSSSSNSGLLLLSGNNSKLSTPSIKRHKLNATSDRQFGDQPDRAANSNNNKLAGQYRGPSNVRIDPADTELIALDQTLLNNAKLGSPMGSIFLHDDLSLNDYEANKADPVTTSEDLLLSAAHQDYGMHHGSIKGYHGDYYQFAESHKKGQFDSGFKRGGKKFQVSGHSSQHKSHAEGHVNWHGKKGKGVQYWDYKHKNKKHHHHHGHHHQDHDHDLDYLHHHHHHLL